MERVTRSKMAAGQRRSVRWARRLGGLSAGVLGLTLAGCGHFIDDVTAVSPEGKFTSNLKLRYNLLFHRPPPLEVLAKSNDGDLRMRAYQELREPKQHGGTAEEQDMMLDLLTTASKSERDLVCRLAAVEKLGEFKDPRAVQALNDAFYAPANFNDKNPVVRVAAIRAMARVGHADSAKTLTEAVTRDPAMDVRMAAADGLGNFQSYQATSALVRVLKEEKDVALRFQAKESLTRITGKDLPPQASEWESYLEKTAAPDHPITREPSKTDFFKLVSWWEEF